MKRIGTLLLTLFCGTATSQSPDFEGVHLGILSDTLTTVSRAPRVLLKFNVENYSTSNLILFELNSEVILDSFGMMDPFCDQETTSAAIRLYVFDATSKPVTAIHWYINDLKTPMTRERLDSIFTAHKESYSKRRVTLKQQESQSFQQEIDLQEFHLEKGQYFIQLLYFAGKRIRNFVTEDEILNDKRNFNAEVFQGCLRSNRAVLLVE